MSEFWVASLLALWLLTLFLTFLLAGALRQIGLLQIRLGSDPGALITRSGLDRGVAAPDFQLVDVRTLEEIRLSSLPKRPRVLAFLSTNCSSCIDLIPHLNEVLATRGQEFDFLVLCRGSLGACQAVDLETGLRARMLHDAKGATQSAFEVSLTPFVFVLDADNRVLIRGVANNWVQLDALLDQEGSLEPGLDPGLEVGLDHDHDHDRAEPHRESAAGPGKG